MHEAGEGEETRALKRGKSQIPNPKLQRIPKLQIPKAESSEEIHFAWDLRFPWDFGFGIWNFQRS
jgi:hypothetical protein